MTTIVVGGGLMGLTTAQVLASRGVEVTLLEAREDVALDASFANGGMLTPSLPAPWNSPGVWRYLAASLFDPRSSMKLRLSALPSLAGWGWKFLKHSGRPHFEQACAENFALAQYSLQQTQGLTEQFALDYCRGTNGTLSVFRSRADFEEQESVCRGLAAHGMHYVVQSVDDVIARVPALAGMRNDMYNAIWYPDDESGDAQLFCKALVPHIEAAGAHIECGVAVTRIVREGRRVVGVETDDGTRSADNVVIACGTRSAALLAGVNLPLGVKPVKGYSVTVDLTGIEGMPGLTVLDDSMHAGMTPLGNRLRLVGTAEFSGFDLSINRVRTNNLYSMFESMLPEIASQVDPATAVPWAGLRPMSYDGKPFIGETDLPGLFVNAGHGHLGWTMAMGSAQLLADALLDERSPIDRRPFSPARQ